MPLCTTTILPVQSRCGWAFSSVGRPCWRVADAVGAIQWVHADGFFQVTQLAFGAADLQTVRIAGYSDSRGIVAPVFQPPQAIQNDGNDRFLTDITDNSTHDRRPNR